MKVKATIRRSYIIMTVLIIISIVLGVFDVQAKDAGLEPVQTKPASYEIKLAEGDSLHLVVEEGQEITFGLSVAAPEEGVHYHWEVMQPALLGKVWVMPDGSKVSGSYMAGMSGGGEDHFLVQVTDGNGGSAQVYVQVSIELQRILLLTEYDYLLESEMNPSLRSTLPKIKSILEDENNQSGREKALLHPMETVGPYMYIYPQFDSLIGFGWPSEVEITLKVNEVIITTEYSCSTGEVYFYPPQDITPGQIIEMSDGTTTISHVVPNLTVTDFDTESETVSGTANKDSLVDISACDNEACETLEAVHVSSEGTWLASFFGLINISLGTDGEVTQYDEQGNATWIEWSVPDPRMTVRPDDDVIFGSDFLPYTELNIKIGTNEWKTMSEYGGYFALDLSDIFDIQPGDVVEVSDGVNTKAHTVQEISVTEFDWETDIIRGTAEPDANLLVVAGGAGIYKLNVTANGAGDWEADFSSLVDLQDGWMFRIYQIDDDGDATQIIYYSNAIYMKIYPLEDIIRGYYWKPNSEITISIDSDQWVVTSDSQGNFYKDFAPFDIQPGQVVTVSSGLTTKICTVRDVAIIDIDETNDIIRGSATPFSHLEIFTSDGMNSRWDYLEVDSSGNWFVDFSSEINIKPGAYGHVLQYDGDYYYSQTVIAWRIPNPRIWVYPQTDELRGFDWLPETELTISIKDNSWTTISDTEGRFYKYLQFDILLGQEVHITDGTNSITYVVEDVVITEINELADIIQGTSDPNADLFIEAHDPNNNKHASFEIKADLTGAWSAIFSGLVDIGPGVWGLVFQHDENNNATAIHWFLLDPYFIVDPIEDVVYGYGWPANTLVTLEIGTEATPTTSLLSNRATWTEESDYQGFVEFKLDTYDIQAGEVVTMSGGTYTQTHTVAALEITEIDEAADTITGTAEAGSTVEVYAEKWSDSDLLSVVTDGDGIWMAEFDGLVDIGSGASGFARQYDELENATIINWSIEGDYMIFLPLILK